ncbi:MAG: ATP-binding protein [Chloroflexota bacterium]|nr:ATP-binding protein [Chloroflexota bacterium]
MSMRWRLLGSFLLIILIALGAVAIVTRYTTEQEVESFLGHGGQVGLENLANALESFYAENDSWKGVESLFPGGPGRGKGQGTGVNDSSGNHIVADRNGMIQFSPDLNDKGRILPGEDLAQTIPLEVSGEIVGYLIPEGGILELPENFDSLLIERVNRATLVAALISGGLAILLALILAALILKPVRGLTSAVKKLAAGDLSQRISIQGKGEIGTLGDAFNQMSQSLQEAEARRQALTADIAHELRNPLAIQRAHLEALQDGLYPLDHENLALITEQNRQLTRLVEDLRTLALADAGELPLSKHLIDLRKMCTETLARFEPQASRKDIQLSADCESDQILIDADKKRLWQIWDNLMQNSMRYTPKGGKIKLSLQDADDLAVFTIYNNGPNISEEAFGHLFERFYRGDKARDRASGGTGLGLAIARKLTEAHGGMLTVENHPDEGVTFTLELPK